MKFILLIHFYMLSYQFLMIPECILEIIGDDGTTKIIKIQMNRGFEMANNI